MAEDVVIYGNAYDPPFPGIRYRRNDAVHTAGQRDASDLYRGYYDPTCNWCWLGAGHTDHAHRANIERSKTTSAETSACHSNQEHSTP